MTVQAMPWAIQGQSHPAENARNLVAAMFGAPVAALVEGVSITTAGGAHGVVGAGDLVVAQNGTPNMSVNVAAGRAVVRSTEAASLLAGAYSFLNDATVNLSIAASDPTNPRIDLVIAQVRDSNYSGASTDARIAVVTGTPAGSPAVPAVPDSCVVLAQVAVAALATTIVNANIADKRTRAYALGGLVVCTSTTRPSGASLYDGLVIFETDSRRLLACNQALAWVVISDAGTYTPTLANLAIGTGGTPVNTASYTFVGGPAGGILTVEGRIKFGTTAPTLPGASSETFSLPAGYSLTDPAAGLADLNGRVSYYDVTGALIIHGSLQAASASTVYFRLPTAAGSFQQLNIELTAANPFAWAINDEIYYRFSARATGTP